MKTIATSPELTRRHFLQTGLLAAGAVVAANAPTPVEAAVTKPEGDPFRGLKVGITTYTLRKFNLDQAIAMTKQAGIKYISIKEVHLPLKSTTEQRKEARKK